MQIPEPNQKGLKVKQYENKPLVVKLCIVLAIISCLLYANTLLNGYVFDDGLVLSENSYVKQGIKAIPELFSTPHMRGRIIAPNDLYRPLSLIMFAIEYEIFGLNPMLGHLFNILVFAGCAVLLFIFFDKLFDKKKTIIAFIASLLFAIHPIHTEVVANIKSRDELLCFFFAFLSLILFMNCMKKGKTILLLLGSFTLFLSYLSKETVVTFLGIIPFIFFFYYNGNKRHAIYITAATVTITIVFIVIRTLVLNKYNANQPAPIEFMDNALSKAPSIASRFATEILILGKYLKLMFVPYPLLCNYSFNSIPFANFSSIGFWCSLIIYGFLVYIAVSRWIKNKKDPWSFGITFYLATIFLFSNIPFLMGAELAERFAFFPSAGFCIIVALAMEKWVIRADVIDIKVFKNVKVLAVLTPVVLVFSSLTIARNTDWKSNYSLFKRDMEKSPNDSRLYLYTAAAILNNVYPEEPDSARRSILEEDCLVYLRKALAVYPAYSAVYEEIGEIYEHKHLYDSANKYVLKALETGPADPVKYNNAGNRYFSQGRYPMAINIFRKSILMAPGVKYPYFTLSHAFVQLKEYDSAILYFRRALVLDPVYTEAHQGIALAFYNKLYFDSAENHYKQAISLSQNDPKALNDLGILYFNIKKYQLAIEQFKLITAMYPNDIDAYSMIGIAYYNIEKYDSAIIAFNKELTIDPNATRNLPNIANAYKHLGDMEMAIKYEAITRQFFPDFRLE